MPFCINCAREIEVDWKICPHCGKPNVLSQKGDDSSSRDYSSTKQEDSGSYQNLPEEKNDENQNSGDLTPKTEMGDAGSYSLNTKKLEKGFLLDNGRFRIEKNLGSGGFGTVYKAWDSYINDWKALKVIDQEYNNDDEVIFDLQREAKLLMSIQSENVVRIWDIHLPDDIKFLDMELITGGNLVNLKLKYPNKQVPEKIVLDIALQICKGMQVIHNKKIIHKDLKPANIMLTDKGVVKIMDFGISETFRSSMSRLKTAKKSGTPAYMSPEQLIGKDVGKEADIWSFAVMLYELLSGKVLFAGGTRDEVKSSIKGQLDIDRDNGKLTQFGEIGKISHTNETLNQFFTKCFRWNYKERFSNFEEIETFLNRDFAEEKRMKIEAERQKAEQKEQERQAELKALHDKQAVEKLRAEKDDKERKRLTLSAEIDEFLKDANYHLSQNNFTKAREYFYSVLSLDSNNSEAKKGLESISILESDYKKKEIAQLQRKEQEEIRKKEKADEENRKKEKKLLENSNMIFVEGGTFQMGSNDEDSYNTEKTFHKVTLDSFFISKYQLTFAEYDKYCNSTGKRKPDDKNWGRGNRPVINVSWYDAIEYCNWRSKEEGLEICYTIDKTRKDQNNESNYDDVKWIVSWDIAKNGYRLPTEAEWEYAAKGGVKTQNSASQRYSDSNDIDEVAWYYNNSGQMVKKGLIFKKQEMVNRKTHPVGKKKPNELGIYDMSGNVWEWCNDWYGKNYYSKSPKKNPQGPNSGNSSVLRGGSWYDYAYNCRVADRFSNLRGNSNNSIGFRFARTS